MNTLLLFILIGCALSVVTSQHRARKFFIELQAEQESERKLDSEWRELQIEAQTQGAGKRIEQKAANELGMAIPDAKKTVMVVLEGTAPVASGLVNGRSDQAAPHPGPLPEERVRNDARSVLAPSKEAKK
ncbi:MAG: cell division protein FtsL [Betaproteobacteria bacterium]